LGWGGHASTRKRALTVDDEDEDVDGDDDDDGRSVYLTSTTTDIVGPTRTERPPLHLYHRRTSKPKPTSTFTFLLRSELLNR